VRAAGEFLGNRCLPSTSPRFARVPSLSGKRERDLGVAALLLLLLASCAPKVPPPDRLVVQKARFADLEGWASDGQAAALAAFVRSCPRLEKEPDWAEACTGARAVPEGDDAAARRFFETALTPVLVTNHGEKEGLFTGYYEPELAGCRERGPSCSTPIYRRPPELVTVELGRFRPSLKGERIAGKVERGILVPYASRAEIDKGALAGRNLELAYAADPVELFFLQVQGSGRLKLPDGSVLRLAYDGQNGHPYVPIGRVLLDRGALERPVTMQSIKAWLRGAPEKAPGVLGENPSYVFFRELRGEGPVGTMGVALTPGRSLAVDRTFLPLGAPVWLDTGTIRRLVVTQDTGGAIRGPVRGDLFWGAGPEAEANAGAMQAKGRIWLLVPAGVAARLPVS
jgi:membrane-bound lytic murein transglycosylase A